MKDLLLNPAIFCAVIFAALLLCLELGRWLASRSAGVTGHGAAVDGAVFAILGLLIAFTFSGAAGRFDHRRDLIVEEANAIGTAWLRIDVAPVEAQPKLRDAFRRYTDSRVAAYDAVADEGAFRASLDRSAAIQKEIWQLAIAAGKQPDAVPATNMLMLPALNQMFDITTMRTLATQMHPPPVIYAMLFVLALIGAVLAGSGMGAAPRRDWLHMLSFAAIMTVTIYVILDLEYPRLGMINVSSFEQTAIALSRPS